MRYHDITKDDMKNGDGLRVVLWVSGCAHRCPGCHNPVTWDPEDGLEFDPAAEAEIFQELKKEHISGITFSGGDPLFPANRAEIGRLIEKIAGNCPDKTIWLYTGYLWEEMRDPRLHWKGSGNQRVINVKKTIESGAVILHS